MELRELTRRLEAVSQIYAARFDIERDLTWFLLKIQEELGELTDAYLVSTGQSRSRGRSDDEIRLALKDEVSDVLAQTMLFAHHLDIDLEHELTRKWLSHLAESSASARPSEGSQPDGSLAGDEK